VWAYVQVYASLAYSLEHTSWLWFGHNIDDCLQLIDINDQKTVLHDICKNIEIQIDLIEVLQSLLIVEKVSQLMILNMSY